MKYLSPTALMQYEENPYEFYLQRIAEQREPRPPQADYFALGSAFDAYVKVWLAHKLGQSLDPNLLENQVEAQHRKPGSLVMRRAMYCYVAYLDSPAVPWLMARGLKKVEDNVDPLLIVNPKTPDRKAFPLWGKPDGSCEPSDPIDWKTTSTGQPAQGFKHHWVNDGGKWKDVGPHARAMEPLESLNEKWAMQMASYGWLMGHPVGLPMKAVIHQVVVGDSVSIVCIDTTITPEFQHKLADRYHKCWDAYENGTLVPPDQDWARLMAG